MVSQCPVRGCVHRHSLVEGAASRSPRFVSQCHWLGLGVAAPLRRTCARTLLLASTTSTTTIVVVVMSPKGAAAHGERRWVPPSSTMDTAGAFNKDLSICCSSSPGSQARHRVVFQVEGPTVERPAPAHFAPSSSAPVGANPSSFLLTARLFVRHRAKKGGAPRQNAEQDTLRAAPCSPSPPSAAGSPFIVWRYGGMSIAPVVFLLCNSYRSRSGVTYALAFST